MLCLAFCWADTLLHPKLQFHSLVHGGHRAFVLLKNTMMEKRCYELLFVQGTLFKHLFVPSANLDYDTQDHRLQAQKPKL